MVEWIPAGVYPVLRYGVGMDAAAGFLTYHVVLEIPRLDFIGTQKDKLKLVQRRLRLRFERCYPG